MKVSQIKIDSGLQMRAEMDQAVINDYAEALKDGAIFPPVILFHDGTDYHIGDGTNRIFAHKKAGIEIISADVRQGTRRDALQYALSANYTNGARRTTKDKRKAVQVCLDDFEWSERSDREIARMCKVSTDLVSTMRREQGKQPDVIQTTRNGKEVKVKSIKKDPLDEQFEQLQTDDRIQEIATEMQSVLEENEKLQLRVAVAAMEATPEEKQAAQSKFDEMEAQIKASEADKRVLGARCDSLIGENAEMRKQIAYWKKRTEKSEKELAALQKDFDVWKDRALTAEAHLEIDRAA